MFPVGGSINDVCDDALDGISTTLVHEAYLRLEKQGAASIGSRHRAWRRFGCVRNRSVSAASIGHRWPGNVPGSETDQLPDFVGQPETGVASLPSRGQLFT